MIKNFFFRFFLLVFLFLIKKNSFLFSEESSSLVPSSLSIRYGQEKIIKLPGIKRFLAMDPKVILVVKENDTVKITPRVLGETTLIIWADIRYTISVSVLEPIKQRSEQKLRLERALMEKNSFVFNIDYSYSDNSNGEDFNSLENTSNYTQALITMDSPFFKDTKLHLSAYMNTASIEDEDLDFLYGAISDIKIPSSQNFKIDFGKFNENSTSSYTDLGTMKGIRISPLKYLIGVRENPLILSLTVGKSEKLEGTLSSFVSQYTNNSESEFSLLQEEENPLIYKTELSYQPKTVTFFNYPLLLRYDFSFAKRDSDTESKNFFDTAVRMTRKKTNVAIVTGGEIDNPGYQLSYSTNIENFNAKVTYSYKPEEFETPVSTSTSYETKDTQLNLQYKPLFQNAAISKVSFGLIAENTLIHRSIFSKSDRWSYRFFMNADIYNFPSKFYFFYSDMDVNSDMHEFLGYELSTSRRHVLFDIPFSWSLRYRNSETLRESQLNLDSRADAYSLFINVLPIKSLNYTFNVSLTNNENEYINQNQDTIIYGHSLTYNFGMFKNKISGNIGYTYYNSTNEANTDNSDTDSLSHSMFTSFSTKITDFTKLQLSVSVNKNELKMSTSEKEEVSTHFEAYLSSKFYTLFGWRPKTEITVISFYDINANGVYDKEIDRPLRDIEILLNNKSVGTSNDEGVLYMGKVKEFQKIVTVNGETIPTGYVFSTQPKYEFAKLKNSTEVCYFGLALNTEISGTVFNDTNNNGKYDEDDDPLNGIVIQLSNGKSIVTDLRGRYYFSPVAEGEHEISVDVFSLPFGFKSKNNIKQNITVQKGTVLNQDFAFMADRIIKGKVLMREGKRTVPIPNVKLEFMKKEKTTNKDGIFKFTDITKGDNYLKLLLDGITFKIIKISPSPEIFDENLMKVLFKINFSKDPETKEITIILEK